MRRGGAAQATWWCELAVIVLTAVYCAIVGYDIHKGKPHFSSSSWFRLGFCVAWEDQHWNSHNLCFVFDLLIGGDAALCHHVLRMRGADDGALAL